MSALELRGIVKRFPGVLACAGASLSLRSGEVHALVGENGAGKSTLMKIVCGLYAPDEGEIVVHGQPQRFASPRDAARQGIGMVHQHYSLVATLTVIENVLLGLDRPRLLFRSQLAAVEKQILAISDQHGLQVDPRAQIWQLSVGEQQRVEILKLLYRGANILIFDEPTAVLSPPEAAGLHRALRDLARAGRSVVYISHKLDEVFALADRVTVMRRGRVVLAAAAIADTTKDAIAAQLIGQTTSAIAEPAESRPAEASSQQTAARFEIHEVTARGDLGRDALRGLTLQIEPGEIYGIAGVAGNGQRELVEALIGVRPIDSGHVRLAEKDFTQATPQARIAAGFACIPEDCASFAAAPALSVIDNILLKHFRDPRLSARRIPFLLDASRIRSRVEAILRRFDLPPSLCDVRAGTLSGGNLQKVILARELSTQPRILIAAYPGRGLDISAMQTVHRLLQTARADGTAILLISEELDELELLADRIGVLSNGRIIGEVRPRSPTSRQELGRLLGGLVAEASALDGAA